MDRKQIPKQQAREARLLQNEQRLQLAVRDGKLGFWDWDMESGSVTYNDIWAEMIGFTLAEIEPVYETWENRIHPDDKELTRQSLSDHIDGQVPFFESEHRLRTKSGEWRWVLVVGRISETSEEQKPLRMTGIMRDIAQRKTTEEQLVESERRFRNVALTSGDWIWQLDTQGRYVYISENVKTILGYESREMLHHLVLDFVADDQDRDIASLFRKSLERNQPPVDLESWHRHKNGSRVCLLINGISLLDNQGNCYGYFGVAKDITRRKNAETTLKLRVKELEALNRLSRTINDDLSLDAVIQNTVNSISGAVQAELILLYRIENGRLVLKGESLPDQNQEVARIHHIDHCICLAAIRDGTTRFVEAGREDSCIMLSALTRGGFKSFAVVPLKMRSEVMGLLILGSKIQHSFGQEHDFIQSIAGVIAAGIHNTQLHQKVLDQTRQLENTVAERTKELTATNEKLKQEIRERSRIERDLRSAKEQAEQANQAKSRFVANMSHELRTPMNLVIGMTEFVLKTELQFDQRRHLETVLRSAKSLLGLLNRVLNLSKLEEGFIQLENKPFSVRQVLEDSLVLFTSLAEKKQLRLVSQVADSLPACHYGDPTRLGQVLVYLLDNAVKFTENGQVIIRVTPLEDSFLQFSVEDTGVGIPADRIERIFERFTQADSSTTRHFGGIGLGTTLARSLVMLMGGSMEVVSKPGQGSTFTFTVRMAAAPENADCHSLCSPTLSIAAAEDLTPATILVAENSAADLKLLKLHLEKAGFKIIEAVNGSEAFDSYQQQPVDLILMDVHMPEMNGFEATGIIRKLERKTGKHTPIFAVTASMMENEQLRCLEAGMDEVVGKPIAFDDLFIKIRQYLNQGPKKGPDLSDQLKTQSVYTWIDLKKGEHIDTDQVQHQLEKLIALLDRGTIDEGVVKETVNGLANKLGPEKTRALSIQINNFEFEAAIKQLKKIKQALEAKK